jgi:hypothetical protein
MHFIQLCTTCRCQLYDHGSAAAKLAPYPKYVPLLLLLLLLDDGNLHH